MSFPKFLVLIVLLVLVFVEGGNYLLNSLDKRHFRNNFGFAETASEATVEQHQVVLNTLTLAKEKERMYLVQLGALQSKLAQIPTTSTESIATRAEILREIEDLKKGDAQNPMNRFGLMCEQAETLGFEVEAQAVECHRCLFCPMSWH